MKDDELKNIIQNQAEPPKRAGEWSSIHQKIKGRKSVLYGLFSVKHISAGFAVCLVAALSISYIKSDASDGEIANYLLEDSYFDVSNRDEIYAWVD